MANLTAKQQQIYDYILAFTAEHGYPPSVREIGAAVGLKSPSTVHFHMKGLEEAGVIVKAEGKTRAISLVNTEPEPEIPANQVPVVGNVAAGSPILAQECIEDYLPFDTNGLSGEHFDYMPKIVKKGQQYTITVTPRSTEKPVLNRLVIKTDSSDLRFASQIIYLQVRK